MTETSASQLVSKLWSFCHVLRDDGLSYLDYTEQLTFLLFLKMADEREKLGLQGAEIPAKYSWSRLAADDMEGEKLEAHYRDTLAALAKSGGMLGLIFAKAQNRIQDPAKLRRLIVELIGKEQWTSLSADVKGEPCRPPGLYDAVGRVAHLEGLASLVGRKLPLSRSSRARSLRLGGPTGSAAEEGNRENKHEWNQDCECAPTGNEERDA